MLLRAQKGAQGAHAENVECRVFFLFQILFFDKSYIQTSGEKSCPDEGNRTDLPDSA